MPKFRSIAGMAAVLAVGVADVAQASDYTIEGDADSLTLVATQASRVTIVEALVERFALGIGGAAVGEGEVNGRYEGSLSHVLKAILPDRSYAIAYREGRPFRISFTGTGSGNTAQTMVNVGSGVNNGGQESAPTGETASGPSPTATLGNAGGKTSATASSSAEAAPGPSPMDGIGAAREASADQSSSAETAASPSPMDGIGAPAGENSSVATEPSQPPSATTGTTLRTEDAVKSPVPDAVQDSSADKTPSSEVAASPSPMSDDGTAAANTTELAPSPSAVSTSSSDAETAEDAAGLSTEAPVGFKMPGEAFGPGTGPETASQSESGQVSRPPL